MTDEKPLTDMAGDNPPVTWTEEEARQNLQAAMEANQATMNRLHAEGTPVDPFVMLKMRLDFVTNFLLAQAPPTVQFNFAMNWEAFLAKVLEDAETEARKARLAVPPGTVLNDSNGNPPLPGQLQIPGA